MKNEKKVLSQILNAIAIIITITGLIILIFGFLESTGINSAVMGETYQNASRVVFTLSLTICIFSVIIGMGIATISNKITPAKSWLFIALVDLWQGDE